MTYSRTLTALLIGLSLTACATTEWRTITDVKEIAATRTTVNKPNLDLSKVIILRLQRDGQRVEVTSIGPATIGAAKNGPPGARTIFTFSPARDKLVLFGQNVPEFKGFYQEIPLAELPEGKRFRFPVVQEDGSVKEQEFTVEKLISQI
jgi:hypothetical protein